MDSTTSKTEVMKPLFLKAGIPLVISVAGFVCAGILARRRKPSSLETTVSSMEEEAIDSHEEFRDDDEEQMITSSAETLHVQIEEEISGLRNRVEELQKREWDREMQFLLYFVMKEQEFVLMELKNKLSLETVRAEFLGREISSMEAEKQRFQDFLVEYLKVVEQLEFSKLENGLLRRKVKKLLRKIKEKTSLIREKNLKIEAAEAEIFGCHDILETRSNVIKKLEDEVRELQTVVNQMQEEKDELLIKLNSPETSASSVIKIGEEVIGMDDYNQLVNEMEQLRKDRAGEVAELIYLRWSNACLRHELIRSNGQQQQLLQLQIEDKKNYLDLELEGGGEMGDCSLDHHQRNREPGSGAGSSSEASSKRKKLLKKLKRWVEGSDNMKSNSDEKEKHEINCFGRNSVSEEAEEEHLIHARRSCSSA